MGIKAISMIDELKKYSSKRVLDITFSTFFIFFSLPVLIMIALVIKLTSKGPIFFSHERIGLNGKPFRCLKFRTMVKDGEKALQKLLNKDPKLKQEWLSSYKLKNDPRITKIGHFLRKTSLDEIPQFINVLKGDMSVVGPRPMVKTEIEQHIRHQAPLILSVRPGITGLWQVNGRNDVDYSARISLDVEYIKSQSLLLDIKIIAKTFIKMLTRDGAY